MDIRFEPKTQQDTNPPPRVPLQILILEDLPLVQELFRQLFSNREKYVICGICETEEQAVERFSASAPDVVIIDIKLRQGTGIGFLQRISPSIDHTHSPLLIVVTNHAMPALEIACRRAGAHHFLDKGRDLPALTPLIEKWRAQGMPASAAPDKHSIN